MDGRHLNHIELLSIAEKDEQYYKNWIANDIQEITQQCLGIRRWLKFRDAINVLCRLGYMLPRTPGEDFCEVHVRKNAFHSLICALVGEMRIPSILQDLHSITFHLFGDHYELAKRITSTVYTTNADNTYRTDILNKLIGCLSIIKFVLRSPKLEEAVQVSSPTKKSVVGDICQICQQTRTSPTSTLCGHVFCWNCIHQSVKITPECPICRTAINPSRLIYLINFGGADSESIV